MAEHFDLASIPKERRLAVTNRIDTNMRKIRATKLPDGVTQEQMDFMVAAVELEFLKSKRPMQWDAALHFVGIAGLRKPTLRTIFKSEEFKARLELRGLWWPERWREESNEYFIALSAQQLQALQVLTDPTQSGSLTSKLSRVGINYAVYRNWLKMPGFSAALRSISEDMIQDNIGIVHTAVTQKAAAGDMGAAKLFYEVTGRHDPMRQQSLDLTKVIGLLLEVITRHVTDVGVLSAITSDFDRAIAGDNISPLSELPYNPHSPSEDVVDAEVVEEVKPVPDGFFDL